MRKIIGVITKDGEYKRYKEPIVKGGVGVGLAEARPMKPTRFETLPGEPVISSKKQLKDICDKHGLKSGYLENSC
tara:strand:- start:782 stop:1006 length:225 start_codon:yes stop_codon:yes gene_type:complete